MITETFLTDLFKIMKDISLTYIFVTLEGRKELQLLESTTSAVVIVAMVDWAVSFTRQ